MNSNYLPDYILEMKSFSNLTRQVVGPFAEAILVKTQNALLAVRPEDSGVGWHLRRDGNHGGDQISDLMAYLKPSDNVLVVGAHIGALAIPIGVSCRNVTCIEANPDTFELLKFNIEINKMKNCTPYSLAASDQRGELEFLINTVNSGGSKRTPVNSQDIYTYDDPRSIRVQAEPLDSFFSGKQFDVIIMDIEGSEYFALKGMKRILERSRMLIVEFLPHHLQNVSGINVETFLSTLSMFTHMTVPSLKTSVAIKDATDLLLHMYNNDLSDEGVIFENRELSQ